MPRILVADDHAVVRRGLIEILRDSLTGVEFGCSIEGLVEPVHPVIRRTTKESYGGRYSKPTCTRILLSGP